MGGDEPATPTATEVTTSFAISPDELKEAEAVKEEEKEAGPEKQEKKKEEKLEESAEEVVGGHIYSVVNKCKLIHYFTRGQNLFTSYRVLDLMFVMVGAW